MTQVRFYESISKCLETLCIPGIVLGAEIEGRISHGFWVKETKDLELRHGSCSLIMERVKQVEYFSINT